MILNRSIGHTTGTTNLSQSRLMSNYNEGILQTPHFSWVLPLYTRTTFFFAEVEMLPRQSFLSSVDRVVRTFY